MIFHEVQNLKTGMELKQNDNKGTESYVQMMNIEWIYNIGRLGTVVDREGRTLTRPKLQ
jgi:hypothetical protein